ncbi:MAG: hypothetical protein GXY85_06930 [Candidatus Brocadiaceae bacterium]|nr:hypothetical protein [Candidatus Brocadiaceae bacterium]
MSRQAPPAGDSVCTMAAVFLLAAGILSLELALMRCLSVARWHHFAYLVVSTALLGFGVSGTLLAFAGAALRRRFHASCAVLAALFALSTVWSLRAAQALPLDARYVLYSGRQAAWLLLYHLLLLVPFLFGATAIGLALSHRAGRPHALYGANLLGSGAGVLLALGLMFLLPEHHLIYASSALGAMAAVVWALRRPALPAAVAAALIGGFLPVRNPRPLQIDEHKMLSTLRRWEQEGRARHLATARSPRSRLDVYDSPLLHHTLFAGLAATTVPPRQMAVLADGEPAATVFRISSPEEAAILDHTPMALPYRLLGRPRVLLLGEAGGTNVWLARRMGARAITVVQPDPALAALMQAPLAAASGRVLLGPDVRVVVAEPRTFVDRTEETFDLVQIVTAEGMPAASGGLLSLHEDHLLTREGLAACLARLSEGGLLGITRGLQAPPRDGLKVFAALRAALETRGAEDPGRHLVLARNYLASINMASARPLTPAQCRTLLSAASELTMDVEWAPCEGLQPEQQINRVDGPPGQEHSWYHHAAVRILSADREAFFRDWAYDVRPPTDDSPYFHNFFRWRSLPRLIEAHGGEWLRRSELGYVVLVLALAQALVAGAALILLPLAFLKRRGPVRARAAVCAYFSLLGLAYLTLEMAFMLQLTRFLGDPIYAAAIVISGFLCASGLGSLMSGVYKGGRRRAILVCAAGTAVLAGVYAAGLHSILGAFIGLPLPARAAVALALAAPPAFLMGWLFPNGLALVERGAPGLVPWAWGINGFASVAASPLAVLLAMGAGYPAVLLLAGGLYAAAALVSRALPGSRLDAPTEAD